MKNAAALYLAKDNPKEDYVIHVMTRMSKLKKTKKKSVSKLKKELDIIFSQYIRLKYSRNDVSSCITCGTIKLWRELHCGHFVSRQHLATRYEEKNCRPQCVGCNVFGKGQAAVFAEKLTQEYGEGIVSELYKKARAILKVDSSWYEEKIKEYKVKLNTLLSN